MSDSYKQWKTTCEVVIDDISLFSYEVPDSAQYTEIDSGETIVPATGILFEDMGVAPGDVFAIKSTSPVSIRFDGSAGLVFPNVNFLVIERPFTSVQITAVALGREARVKWVSITKVV
jgi:hypothetical protein